MCYHPTAPSEGARVPVATPLFTWGIGIPDVYSVPGQRKVWFPPLIDIAQLPAAIAARERQDSLYLEPQPDPGSSSVPVDDPDPWEYVYAEPPPVVRPVLPGPVAVRPAAVPTSTVVVDSVSTEVEHHPEGDFPAGSIFAPGRTWGTPVHELDTDPYVATEEDELAFGDILDWGLTTLSGQQPWQTFGAAAPAQPGVMNFAAPNLPVPSGVPGQPTTIYGYQEGVAMTGDNCGNRRYVTLDRETGKISCRRRRRRRLLTNRDLADLASLKTITGGGAALNSAVIRAVR